jgi:beta-glucanase (GH16 family)
MDGWMGGWMDGWMGGKAELRIAYSNQKYCDYKNSSQLERTNWLRILFF